MLVLYVCVSVPILQISLFLSFFKIPHRDIIWYLSFSFWLISLSMIISRTILCCCKWPYFTLCPGWIIFIVHTYCIFVHSSIGHSGCYHVLAIVSGAAMDIGVYSRYTPRRGNFYFNVLDAPSRPPSSKAATPGKASDSSSSQPLLSVSPCCLQRDV